MEKQARKDPVKEYKPQIRYLQIYSIKVFCPGYIKKFQNSVVRKQLESGQKT